MPAKHSFDSLHRQGRLRVWDLPTRVFHWILALAVIGLVVMQVATGLVADDEIATTGALSRFVSSATSARANFWHADVGNRLLIVMVVMHIAAIVFYGVKEGQRLVPAMWHRDKQADPAIESSRDDGLAHAAAPVVFVGGIAVSGWIWSPGAS
jgi:cytochrome b